jgi:hypothetical protein
MTTFLTRREFASLTIGLLLPACSGAGTEGKYLGEWVDVKRPYRTARVFRDGAALFWQDNEGTYAARVDDGTLKVSTMMGEIAVQYVPSTGHLVAAGYEFRRADSTP